MTNDINLFHVEHLTADEVLQCIKEEMGSFETMIANARQNMHMYDGTENLNNDDFKKIHEVCQFLRDCHNNYVELVSLLNYIEAKDEEKGIREASA